MVINSDYTFYDARENSRSRIKKKKGSWTAW